LSVKEAASIDKRIATLFAGYKGHLELGFYSFQGLPRKAGDVWQTPFVRIASYEPRSEKNLDVTVEYGGLLPNDTITLTSDSRDLDYRNYLVGHKGPLTPHADISTDERFSFTTHIALLRIPAELVNDFFILELRRAGRKLFASKEHFAPLRELSPFLSYPQVAFRVTSPSPRASTNELPLRREGGVYTGSVKKGAVFQVMVHGRLKDRPCIAVQPLGERQVHALGSGFGMWQDPRTGDYREDWREWSHSFRAEHAGTQRCAVVQQTRTGRWYSARLHVHIALTLKHLNK
jgi:hypothetical protein